MKSILIFSFCFSLILLSCSKQTNKSQGENHLITDSEYLKTVEQEFEEQKKMASNRSAELFDVFNDSLSTEETESLKFLYAFMPLSDLADYDGKFFADLVKVTLKARNEMAWGKQIPEDIFLHFVLPHRVNNENLDTFRVAMYNELKQRLTGINDIKTAALEINHWCHEKVNYTGADIRTSAPLATMKTSWGRCGEESTFTVSALRAAGIPARQCYTPRWAHTDDNHAWVEIWADGSWYFLGACEPEAHLNMGWFTEPARRAMLVHSKAFGKYRGNELVLNEKKQYAELNLLSHYAETKPFTVIVEDENRQRIENATVEAQLYNYAEFYPLMSKTTDKNGSVTFHSGLGDLLMWAYKGDDFGFKKISVNEIDTLTITINKNQQTEYSVEFDYVPPIEKEPLPVNEEGAEENKKRFAQEDSIRNLYKATFMSSESAAKLASELKLNADSVLKFIDLSEGNYAEIETFLRAKSNLQSWKLKLLSVISEKDLRDTKASILLQHLHSAFLYSNIQSVDYELFVQYILNPRIANEMLVDYRPFLQKQLGDEFIKKCKSDINVLIDWIKTNISMNKEANFYGTPITPKGVFSLKVSDEFSRDIFFVAACRSMGLLARINETNFVPQYFNGTNWIDVFFEAQPLIEKSTLRIANMSPKFEPKYFSNFTLARFNNGKYITLEFPYNADIKYFSTPQMVDAGKYLLVSGNRLANGSVLVKLSFFEILEEKLHTHSIEIRHDVVQIQSFAKMDLANAFVVDSKGTKNSLKNLCTQGAVILWVAPDGEPSKHIFADLPAVNTILNTWGGKCIFLTKNNVQLTQMEQSKFNLPKQTIYATDTDFELLTQIEKIKNRKLSTQLPVIIVAKPNGDLVFYSEGYTIGIGEQIAKVVQAWK